MKAEDIKKRIMRAVSLLTLGFFLVSQVAYANPGAGIEIAVNREMPGFLRIDIPDELASLDGIWEAAPSANSRTILHIQNAHANYSAQKKIQELLAYLNKTYAIKTIFVEGAVEDLNPDYLKLFPETNSNLELADLLAQQGEISGAELFILRENEELGPAPRDSSLEKTKNQYESQVPSPESRAAGRQVKAVGIENASLYRSNYEALKTVFGAETLVNRYLSGYECRLEALSSKIFSSDLRRVLADWRKFEKGHREFMPYVRALVVEAKDVLKLDLESLFAQVEWPQIARLLVLQEMEKDLDAEKALKEKDALLRFLKAKGVSAQLIAEVENFKEQRLSVRQGQGEVMQPRDVLEALIRQAGPRGFNFRDYPAFSLYAGYLILKSELDAKGLFDEVKVLFEKILDGLAATPDQKSLLALYRDEELARKLLRLELSRRDWQEALGRKAQLEMDPLISRLKELSAAVTQGTKLAATDLEVKPLSPKFRDEVLRVYAAAFNFYEFARQREAAFYEKIDSVMSFGSLNKAVLITGGFHTDGMTDLFRERNISYGVLTPRLMEKSDEKMYRNTMLQNEQQLFSISNLELAAFASRATLERQGVNFPKKLGSLIAAFRSKLPGESATGRGVAAAFNASAASVAFKVTLEFDADASAKTGKDTYKIKVRGEEKLSGVEVPVVRSGVRGKIYQDREELDRDIAGLEEQLEASWESLPKIGFHADSGQTDFWYFLFDRNEKKHYSRIDYGQFKQRVLGTLGYIARAHGKYSLSPGKESYPALSLVVEKQKLRLRANEETKMDQSVNIGLDLETGKGAMRPYFFVEGVLYGRKIGDVPAEAKIDLGLSAEELAGLNQWVDKQWKLQGNKEDDHAGKVQAKEYLGARLLYKKALESLISLAAASLAVRSDVRAKPGVPNYMAKDFEGYVASLNWWQIRTLGDKFMRDFMAAVNDFRKNEQSIWVTRLESTELVGQNDEVKNILSVLGKAGFYESEAFKSLVKIYVKETYGDGTVKELDDKYVPTAAVLVRKIATEFHNQYFGRKLRVTGLSMSRVRSFFLTIYQPVSILFRHALSKLAANSLVGLVALAVTKLFDASGLSQLAGFFLGVIVSGFVVRPPMARLVEVEEDWMGYFLEEAYANAILGIDKKMVKKAAADFEEDFRAIEKKFPGKEYRAMFFELRKILRKALGMNRRFLWASNNGKFLAQENFKGVNAEADAILMLREVASKNPGYLDRLEKAWKMDALGFGRNRRALANQFLELVPLTRKMLVREAAEKKAEALLGESGTDYALAAQVEEELSKFRQDPKLFVTELKTEIQHLKKKPALQRAVIFAHYAYLMERLNRIATNLRAGRPAVPNYLKLLQGKTAAWKAILAEGTFGALEETDRTRMIGRLGEALRAVNTLAGTSARSDVRDIGTIEIDVNRGNLAFQEGAVLEPIREDDMQLPRPVMEKIRGLIRANVTEADLAEKLIGKLDQESGIRIASWSEQEDLGIVLRELLVNALRSVRENNPGGRGKVQIQVFIEAGRLKVLIKDNGTGFIGKDGQPMSTGQIENFFKEGVSTKSKFQQSLGNVGVGLGRSRELLQRGSLKGTLTAYNDLQKGKVRGAIFEISIPVSTGVSRSDLRITLSATDEGRKAQEEAYLEATKDIEGVRVEDAGSWERVQKAFALLHRLSTGRSFTEEERMAIEYQRFVNQLDARKARVRKHQGELEKPQDYYGGEEMQRWFEAMLMIEGLEKDPSKATPELLKLLHGRAYLNTPQTYYEYRKINDAFGRKEITEAERDKALEDLLQYEQAKNDFKSRKKVGIVNGKAVFFDEKMRDAKMTLASVLRGLYWSVTHLGRPWKEGVAAHNQLIGRFRDDPRDELQYVHSNTVTIEGIKQADLITVGPVFTLSEMQKLTGNEHFGETRPDGTVNYENLNPLIDLRQDSVRRYQGPHVLKYTEAGNGEYDWRNPKTPAFNAIIFYTPVARVESSVQDVFRSFQQKFAALQTADPERKNMTAWVDMILDFQKEVVMIHPFLDGNGRTSRLLTDFLFGVIGLPPPLFPNEQDVIASPGKSRQFALKAMGEYLAAYRNLLLVKNGAALPADSLKIPARSKVVADPVRANGTEMGHDQFPSNPTVTTIVIAKTVDGKLVLTRRNGQLALAERYVLGGESAEDTAMAALTDPDVGLGMDAANVQIGEVIAFESKPFRTQALYRYSAVVEARVSDVPANTEAVEPGDVDLEQVLPEHREILRKYLSEEDFLARSPEEGLVNIRDYKKRSAVEKSAVPLKARATQEAQEMIRANGFVQPVVASDTVIEYFDQDGNFQGIVLVERLRDGHLATPGGFARQSESAEYNSARENFEETGLSDIKLKRLLRLATRNNRDERSFIWSPLFLAQVKGRRPTAGDDAKSIRIFKNREELETYLLDPKNWIREGHSEDALAASDAELLAQIAIQRSKTGKIDRDNIVKLQSLMENRRRARKFGVLWADHLEHLETYFNFKEAEARKTERYAAAVNLEPSRVILGLDQLMPAAKDGKEGPLDYDVLRSVKDIINQGVRVVVVGTKAQKEIFEKLSDEIGKFRSLEESRKTELKQLFSFEAKNEFARISYDGKTVNLSGAENSSVPQGARLSPQHRFMDRSGDSDITTLLGFMKWLDYVRRFKMMSGEGARGFDYEKARILFVGGISLEFYSQYAAYEPEALRRVLMARARAMGDFVKAQRLSDLHTHPTGAGRASFVLEMAWRDLQKPKAERQIDWSWINKEFEKNIDDLSYGSFEEIVEDLNLSAIHFLIATPHKTEDKSLVEYFQRYAIIQNVNVSEETVVDIARGIAEDSARQGVRYLELRGAVATQKNEDLVQTDYLPAQIRKLSGAQLAYLRSLPRDSAFRRYYSIDDAGRASTLDTTLPEADAAVRQEIFTVLQRLNLIGMEILLNTMANYRGMKQARGDYPDFRFSMIVILPKPDSREMSGQTIEEVTRLKRIARALLDAGVQTPDAGKIDEALKPVIPDAEERSFYVQEILKQAGKDPLADIIAALEGTVGFDTAGPEFLYQKDYPKQHSDFIVEFDKTSNPEATVSLTVQEKQFLRTTVYRGNWISGDIEKKFNQYKGQSLEDLRALQAKQPELGLQDMIRFREILEKVRYPGRVRFMAQKLHGVFDAESRYTDGTPMYTEATSHAGEAYASLEDGLKAVREAIEFMGVTRIGHGIAVGTDPEELLGTTDGYGKVYDVERVNGLVAEQEKLIRTLIEKNVAIEINVSSNLQTGNVMDVFKHPFFRLFRAGAPLVVGTDGLTVSNTTLADEIVKAAMAFNMTNAEVQVLIDRVASRLGIVSMESVTKHPVYRGLFDRLPDAERAAAKKKFKTLLHFSSEGKYVSDAGSDVAKWIANVRVPLDVVAASAFLLGRSGDTSSEGAKFVAENAKWKALFDEALDVATRISQRDGKALEKFMEWKSQGLKEKSDMVLLVMFTQFINAAEGNDLGARVEQFQKVRKLLENASAVSRSDLRKLFDSADFLPLEKVFVEKTETIAPDQARAPPAPVQAPRKAEVFISFSQVVDGSVLGAFLESWRLSPGLFTFRVDPQDPNKAAIETFLKNQGFEVVAAPAPGTPGADILVTDDSAKTAGREKNMVIAVDPATKKATSYEFDGIKVSDDMIGAAVSRAAYQATGRVKTLDEMGGLLEGRKVLALTGFSMQSFDKENAELFLDTLLETMDPSSVVLVMGTNEDGLDKLILQAVERYQAKHNRKYLVVGGMPAEGFKWRPGYVDYLVESGENWSDKTGETANDDNAVFLRYTDVMFRLGGGPIARKRTYLAMQQGIPTFIPNGYGAVSKKYGIESVAERKQLAESIHEALFAKTKMSAELGEVEMPAVSTTVEAPAKLAAVKIAAPDVAAQKAAMESLGDKVLLRVVGGSSELEDPTPEHLAGYYGRVYRFYADFFGAYSNPSKVAIMVDLEPDLFQQQVIQAALEKGVQVIGVLRDVRSVKDKVTDTITETAMGLDLDTVAAQRKVKVKEGDKEVEKEVAVDAKKEVLTVRHTADLWERVDGTIIMGGNIEDNRQKKDLLESRKEERHGPAAIVDGFGNDSTGLSDVFSKMKGQPMIVDARALVVYLQPRLRTTILNAENLKKVKDLKLEAPNPFDIPLVFQRSNNDLEGVNPAELIANMKGSDPALKKLFESPQPIGWEGGTVESHTAGVASNFEKMLRLIQVALSPEQQTAFGKLVATLRFAVALHDIGKSLSHERQHEETKKIIDKKFKDWGMTESQKVLANALVAGDPVGQLLYDLTYTPEAALSAIRATADQSGVDRAVFYAAIVAYFIADSSSYPVAGVSGYVRQADGSTVFKRDYKAFETLLGLMHDDAAGFDGSVFLSKEKVDTPGFLPAKVQEMRFISKSPDGRQRASLSYFDGMEQSDPAKAIAFMDRNGLTNRVGIDLTGMDAAQVANLSGEFGRIAAQPDASKNTVVVLRANDPAVLAAARTIAQALGLRTMALVPLSLFDPSSGQLVSRNDLWIINNENDGAVLDAEFKAVATSVLSVEASTGSEGGVSRSDLRSGRREKLGEKKTISAEEVMARLKTARVKDEAASITPNNYIPEVYALLEKGARQVIAADLPEIDAADAMALGTRLIAGPGYRRNLKAIDAEVKMLEAASRGDEASELFRGKIREAMGSDWQSVTSDPRSEQILNLALQLAWTFKDPTYFRQLKYTFFGTASLPTPYALVPAFEPVKKGLAPKSSVALSAGEQLTVAAIKTAAREILSDRGADGRGLNYEETRKLVLAKIKDTLLTPAGISALLNQVGVERLYNPDVAAHYNEWVVEVLLGLKEKAVAKPAAGQFDVTENVSNEIALLLATAERDQRKANQGLLPGELTFQDLFSTAPGGFLAGFKRVILFSSYSGKEEGVKNNPAVAAALGEELMKLAEGIDPSEVLFIAGATPFGGDMTGMRVAHGLGFKMLGVLPAYSLKYVPVKMDHYFVIEEGERGDESEVLREIATRVREKGAFVAVMGGGDQSYHETASMLALGVNGLMLTGVHEMDERDRVGASAKTAEDVLFGVNPAGAGQEIRIRDFGREALAQATEGQPVDKVSAAIIYALLHTFPSLDALSQKAFDRYWQDELADWFKPYVVQLTGAGVSATEVYDIFSAAISKQGRAIRGAKTEAEAQAVLNEDGALAQDIRRGVEKVMTSRAEVRTEGETIARSDLRGLEFSRVPTLADQANLQAFSQLSAVAATSKDLGVIKAAYSKLREILDSGLFSDEQRQRIEYRRFINQTDDQKARARIREGLLGEAFNYYGGAEMTQWYAAMRMTEGLPGGVEVATPDLIKSIHKIAYRDTPQIYYEVRRIRAWAKEQGLSEAEKNRLIDQAMRIETIKDEFKAGKISEAERDRRMSNPKVLEGTYWSVTRRGGTWQQGRNFHNENLVGKFRSDPLDDLKYDVTSITLPGATLADIAKTGPLFSLEELRGLTGNPNFGINGDYTNKNPYMRVVSVEPYLKGDEQYAAPGTPAGLKEKVQPVWKESGKPYEGQAMYALVTFAPVEEVNALVGQVFQKLQEGLAQAKSESEKIDAILAFQKELIYVHPFLDGSGRSSRLLSDLIYQKLGLPVPLYPNENDMLSSADEARSFAIKGMADYLSAYQNAFRNAAREKIRSEEEVSRQFKEDMKVIRAENPYLGQKIQNFKRDRLVFKMEKLFAHEGPSSLVLKNYLVKVSAKTRGAMLKRDEDGIGDIRGVSGDVSLLYELIINRKNGVLRSLHALGDIAYAVNPFIDDGRKEIDALIGRSTEVGTVAEAKFHGDLWDMIGQVLGGYIEDDKLSHLEALVGDENLREVRNMLFFAENDGGYIAEAILAYLRQNPEAARGLDVTEKGYSFRLELKDMPHFLLDVAGKIVQKEARGRRLPSKEVVRRNMQHWIDLKLKQLGDNKHFDFIIAVSNARLPKGRGQVSDLDELKKFARRSELRPTAARAEARVNDFLNWLFRYGETRTVSIDRAKLSLKNAMTPERDEVMAELQRWMTWNLASFNAPTGTKPSFEEVMRRLNVIKISNLGSTVSVVLKVSRAEVRVTEAEKAAAGEISSEIRKALTEDQIQTLVRATSGDLARILESTDLSELSPEMQVALVLMRGLVPGGDAAAAIRILMQESALLDSVDFTRKLRQAVPNSTVPMSEKTGKPARLVEGGFQNRESADQFFRQIFLAYLLNPNVDFRVLALGGAMSTEDLSDSIRAIAAEFKKPGFAAKVNARVGDMNAPQDQREAKEFLKGYMVSGTERAFRQLGFDFDGVNAFRLWEDQDLTGDPRVWSAVVRASQAIKTEGFINSTANVALLKSVADSEQQAGFKFEKGHFVINARTLSALTNIAALYEAFQQIAKAA